MPNTLTVHVLKIKRQPFRIRHQRFAFSTSAVSDFARGRHQSFHRRFRFTVDDDDFSAYDAAAPIRSLNAENLGIVLFDKPVNLKRARGDLTNRMVRGYFQLEHVEALRGWPPDLAYQALAPPAE